MSLPDRDVTIMHQPYDDGYNIQRMAEALIRMEGRLDAVLQQLERQDTYFHKCNDDHEARLREIEDWKHTMIGKFAAIGLAIAAGLSVVVSWITSFFIGGRP